MAELPRLSGEFSRNKELVDNEPHRKSLDRLGVPEEPLPRTSFEKFRNRLSKKIVAHVPSLENAPRNLPPLPENVLAKIFSFMAPRDLGRLLRVNLVFHAIAQKEIRRRWEALLPRPHVPRPTVLRSPSSNMLKDSEHRSAESKPIGLDQLKSAITHLAAHFVHHRSRESEHAALVTPLENPFKMDPFFVDCVQIPFPTDRICSITAEHPFPILIVGTSKGSVFVFRAPVDKSKGTKLDLIASVETGLQEMKLVSGNGRIFATSKHSSLVSIWDLETLKPLSTIGIKSDAKGLLTCLDYERSTNQIATGDHWGTCNVWDARSNKHIFEGISNHTMAVEDVRIDNNSVVAANGMITLYSLSKGKIVRRDGDSQNHFTNAVVCDHNKYFIGATKQGPVTLFPFDSSEPVSTIPYSLSPVRGLSLLHDNLFLSDSTGSCFLCEVPYLSPLKWRIKRLDILNHTPNNCMTIFHHNFLATASNTVIKTWNYMLEGEISLALTPQTHVTNSQNCTIQ